MKKDITGELSVLSAIRRENGIEGAMSLGEIADCIGCAKQSLHKIEKRAMAKVRARLFEQCGVDVGELKNGVC